MATRCKDGETQEQARARLAARAKLWRERNYEKYIAKRREWTAKNRKRLSDHERERSAKRYAESPEYRAQAINRNKRWQEKVGSDYLHQQANDRTRKIKIEVFEAYGSKCACCGDKHFEFMSIHHIDGKGAAHRESLGNKRQFTGKRFYFWLKEQCFPKDNFEMLCFNCHMAKETAGRECPHETERRMTVLVSGDDRAPRYQHFSS
jgi:hypothetical protein